MNDGDPEHSRCDAPQEPFEFPQEMTDCRFTVGSIVWVRQDVSCFVVVGLLLLRLLMLLVLLLLFSWFCCCFEICLSCCYCY
jgi:hypothetical protein